MKQEINVIEIDGRDARYQSGIARYLDILADNMPKHVKTLRVIFYFSPEFKDIRISDAPGEVQVHHPAGFPSHTLFQVVLQFIGARLGDMRNLIIKSNCLGYDAFVYFLKSHFYCKTIGVLHCLPRAPMNAPAFPAVNPFFNMDHVVLVCDRGKEFLNGVRNKQPFSVICNGIEKPKLPDRKTDDGTFRFIFANGFAKHKGFEKIIPAIEKVARKHKIEIIAIGGGEIPAAAGLPITNYGLIDDHGNICELYAQADAALFASESEACSFAGIEAMAFGLPIISTDAAGLAEMFGKSALFVNMNEKFEINADDYAAQMIRLIESKRLRVKLGIMAYARYLERYTAKKMTVKTLDLYKKILGF
ncbi:MAG: glycosyltransferase family 4 protein [Rickettsiales bacterium]|jgi:glycosyltransferase involved in cell wall biosynthesis|nr:glycosyltransferase family 4 protein [Rickettsiales bacterium]